MATRNRQAIGRYGESLATSYLRREGYQILGRNYRAKIGELDLIAAKGHTLVFVEVKTRTETSFAEPFEAVDRKKQQKLLKLADGYLAYGGMRNLGTAFSDTRLDVISILMSKDGVVKSLKHIRDAFSDDR
ncbi:MAG: YraN family protein [Actinomycetota bacterium]